MPAKRTKADGVILINLHPGKVDTKMQMLPDKLSPSLWIDPQLSVLRMVKKDLVSSRGSVLVRSA